MSADDVFGAAIAIAREVVDQRKGVAGIFRDIATNSADDATTSVLANIIADSVERSPFIEDRQSQGRRLRGILGDCGIRTNDTAGCHDAAAEFAAPYLARIVELETTARRNRIAIDALTESGKASAAIIAKLESDSKLLHDALARATMDSLGKAIQGES